MQLTRILKDIRNYQRITLWGSFRLHILKYLLLALAGPCHLREQALERGVLVQLVLLHQPAQVARRRRQLDLRRRR